MRLDDGHDREIVREGPFGGDLHRWSFLLCGGLGWAGLGWAGVGGGHSAGLKSLVSGAGEHGRGDYVGGRKGDGLYLYVGYLVGEKKCRGTCLKNIGSSPSGAE